MNLYDASRFNNIKALQTLVKRGFDNIENASEGAGEGGHKELLQRLLKYYCFDSYKLLYGLYKGGHKDLIELYKGHTLSFYYIIIGTYYTGNIDFINEQNKDEINHLYSFYDGALEGAKIQGACLGNHLELVKPLLKKYSYMESTMLNYALFGACEGGHKEIVDYLISLGTNNWNWGLQGACEGGHLDLIELMISKGATNFMEAVNILCTRENYYLLKLFIRKYKYEIFNYNVSINNSIFNSYLNLCSTKKQILPVNYDLEKVINS